MKKIALREITGLVNSLARQLFSGYGLAYIAYVVRAVMKRPDLIVNIMTMAVQGHHYFTITRQMMALRRQEALSMRRAIKSEPARDTMEQLVPEPSTAT